MAVRQVRTIILGSGPAGLTAGLELAENGQKPILLEKGKNAGGLMRSFKRGDFIVDIGRKQLYSRIPEIHDLWCRLLGDDYRPYQRRVGILYQGSVLESSRSYKGPTLGMPPGLLLRCTADLVKGWMFSAGKPENHEEYWHRRRGKLFTQILTQGFEERFRGDLWKNMPVPADEGSGQLSTIAAGIKSKMATLFSQPSEGAKNVWRHPAKGTGQIVDRLEEEIKKNGGEILFQTDVTEVRSKGNRITTVVCKTSNGETIEFQPEYVIGSIPIELLAKLVLTGDPLAQKKAEIVMPRSAALVYLFLDGPPPFPHFFLEVSDPDLKCGRIVNYNALGGDMVPPGKTCLCVEFFCDSTDALMKKSETEIGELAIEELEKSGILERSQIKDIWPLKFVGADAATDYRDWMTDERRQLLNSLTRIENLYFVNRAGTDAASFAGLEAARAILKGDRKQFDQSSDPRHSLTT